MVPQHDPPIHIIIDKKQYAALKPEMTGGELRVLADPDIGGDRDLFRVVPGSDDEKIGNAQEVQLKPGMHFYSAPSTINPGAF